MTLRTTATLDDLFSVLTNVRYSGVAGARGWGSVKDGTDELVGQVLRERPRGGRPEPVLGGDLYPRQLRARLYWEETDKTLERAALGDPSNPVVSRLRAADVTFAEGDRDGELIGLLCERNPSRLRNTVVPEVTDLLRIVDRSATVAQDENFLEFGDDDFFRWLVYRYVHKRELDADLSLVEVRAIANQDVAYRPTNMSKGIDMDRPELLALLASNSNKFGPAKFIVWSENLGLEISLEATSSGQFSVFRGQSGYELEAGDEMDHDEIGLRLLQDAAFNVLPDLKQIYNADSMWRDTEREKFRQEARDALKAALAKI